MKIGPPWSIPGTRPVPAGQLLLLAAPFLILPISMLLAVDLFHSVGDIDLYQAYARGLFRRPIELPREYPAPAAAIFVLPLLLAPGHYLLCFALLAAAATSLILLLVDRLGGDAWWLLLLLTLAGWGTLLFRFDVFVVLLTVLAFRASERQRYVQAQLLLVLAAALKLYPLVLMPLVVLAEWRTTRRWSALVSGGLALVLLAALLVIFAPAASRGMLGFFGDRPLQIESLGASLVWLIGPAATELSYGSINLVAPAARFVADVLGFVGPALLLLVYAAVAQGWLRSATAWALCLMLLIAGSKVFSTQYVLWALPFVVLARFRERESDEPTVRGQRFLWLALCALTGLIYPLGDIWWSRTAQLTVLCLRNALWLLAAVALPATPALRALPERLRRGLRGELRWWRSIPGPLVALVLLLALADTASLHRSSGRTYTLDVGAWNDEEMLRLQGFHHGEQADISYRWTGERSMLAVHSAVQLPRAELELLVGGLPSEEPRTVALAVGDAPPLPLPVAAGPRRYQVLLPSTALRSERLAIQLSGPTTTLPDDGRPLGLRLDAVRLRWPLGRWLLPGWHTLLVQMALLLVAAASLRRLPLPRPVFFVLLGGVVVLLALGLGRAPFGLAGWQSRGLAWSTLGVLVILILAPVPSPRPSTQET